MVSRALVLLAAALLVIALAGCGEKEEPTTTTPPEGARDASSAPNVTGLSPDAVSPGGATVGGDEPPAPVQVRSTVLAYLSSPDAPRVCDELITPRFLRRAYGDRRGCVAAPRRPASLATSGRLADLRVHGSEATLSARPEGGLYDGETLDFTLVESGGAWRIDRLSSNVPVGP